MPARFNAELSAVHTMELTYYTNDCHTANDELLLQSHTIHVRKQYTNRTDKYRLSHDSMVVKLNASVYGIHNISTSSHTMYIFPLLLTQFSDEAIMCHMLDISQWIHRRSSRRMLIRLNEVRNNKMISIEQNGRRAWWAQTIWRISILLVIQNLMILQWVLFCHVYLVISFPYAPSLWGFAAWSNTVYRFRVALTILSQFLNIGMLHCLQQSLLR